jgi:hypothetical protein
MGKFVQCDKTGIYLEINFTKEISMEPQLIDLGIRLSEALVRNTASAISTKVKALKSKKDDKETINELEEIIQELISDKNELLQISQAYQQELVTQKITDTEIDYITQKLIPTLQKLANATGQSQNINSMVDVLSPLISKETLTILQLLGFNFRKAIGEPLTVLLQKLILSKQPLDSERIQTQLNIQLETLKIAKDPAAIRRLENLSK